MKNTVLFVTGDRGSGKSTSCLAASRILQERGVHCSGILCENSRTADGRPHRIVARDLESGSTRLLADRPAGSASGFRFSQEGFSWADGVLREAVERRIFPLFLDEVGPLELESGGGYMPFLAWVAARRTVALVIAVRTSLVAQLGRYFDSAAPGLWTTGSVAIDENSRDLAGRMIADSLCQVVDPPLFIYSELGDIR